MYMYCMWLCDLSTNSSRQATRKRSCRRAPSWCWPSKSEKTRTRRGSRWSKLTRDSSENSSSTSGKVSLRQHSALFFAFCVDAVLCCSRGVHVGQCRRIDGQVEAGGTWARLHPRSLHGTRKNSICNHNRSTENHNCRSFLN